jgi:hypothetical protein
MGNHSCIFALGRVGMLGVARLLERPVSRPPDTKCHSVSGRRVTGRSTIRDKRVSPFIPAGSSAKYRNVYLFTWCHQAPPVCTWIGPTASRERFPFRLFWIVKSAIDVTCDDRRRPALRLACALPIYRAYVTAPTRNHQINVTILF